IAAGGLALATLAVRSVPLGGGDAALRNASLHWPAPPVVAPEESGTGPVMVSLDYRVGEAERADFLALMQRLRASRLRDGGYGWQLFRVAEEEGLYREVFQVSTWEEHLRQHDRVTEAERDLQAKIAALTAGGAGARIRHLLPPGAAGLPAEAPAQSGA
ncbi:MAG: MFS transporter, partial [Pseudomonadota bacterium]